VGTKVSLFWNAWAWTAEKAGDFAFAEKIFMKAMKKEAKPIDDIKKRHRMFQRRMSRHFLNNNDDARDDYFVDDGNGRGKLSLLSETNTRSNNRSQSIHGNGVQVDENGHPVNQLRQNNENIQRNRDNRATRTDHQRNDARASSRGRNSRTENSSRRTGGNGMSSGGGGSGGGGSGGFKIFVENDAENQSNGGYNLDTTREEDSSRCYQRQEYHHRQKYHLVKEADKKKENELLPEKWNERGGLNIVDESNPTSEETTRQQRSTTTPAFEVFVDDECVQKENRSAKKLNQKAAPSAKKAAWNDNFLDANKSERSFLREKKDAGMADKLAKDPLRYVKHPGKFSSDQNIDKQHHNQGQFHHQRREPMKDKSKVVKKDVPSSNHELRQLTKETSTSAPCGFNKRLVSKDSSGQERCFEEGRAKFKFYTLHSLNLNLLYQDNNKSADKSAMSIIDDSDMSQIDDSVEMEEAGATDTSAIKSESAFSRKFDGTKKSMYGMCTSNRKTETRRVLFEERIKDKSLNASQSSINVSGTSSQLNENEAVGVFRKDEETINTKFARGELSMMFYSPAASCNTSKNAASSTKRGLSSISKPLLSLHTNSKMPPLHCNSFEHQSSKVEEVSDTEENITASFSDVANLLEAAENPQGIFKCISEKSQDPVDKKTNMMEVKMRPYPGDENEQQYNRINSKRGVLRSVQISEVGQREKSDEPCSEKNHNEKRRKKNLPSQEAEMKKEEPKGFTIFCDDVDENDENKSPNIVGPLNQRKINVFEDTHEAEYEERNASLEMKESGDTASFSIFGEAMRNLDITDSAESKAKKDLIRKGKSEKVTFDIFCDEEDTRNVDHGKVVAETIPCKRTLTSGVQNVAKRVLSSRCDDEEVFCNTTMEMKFSLLERVDEVSQPQQASRHEEKKKASSESKAGFSIFCDNDCDLDDFTAHDGPPDEPSEPRFGDISRIATPGEHFDTINKIAISYDILHEKNINRALLEAMDDARDDAIYQPQSSCDDDTGLLTQGIVLDRRDNSLPKNLLFKSPTKGTKISIGGKMISVAHELGRGAYGVVLLCNRLKGNENSRMTVALKVQSPTGCLAWEYSVLKRLNQRLPQNRLKESGASWNTCLDGRNSSPFPEAFFFAAYNNGGLLGMTAGSLSGINLVDVVNANKINGGGPVPELIAMHYTTRMLSHIELLHWHGKMLHCDVKPDNWVITASSTACGNSDMFVEGSDLMLVDFGRAIDLTATNSSDPLKALFTGNIAADGTPSIAMKEDRPWGIDIDTYGLCASTHVLLFGVHMETEKRGSRWGLRKPLRRYWDKELWNTFFDTLLNSTIDGAEDIVSGSHPNSLRSIRKMFEAHLDKSSRRAEITSLLKHQTSFLPKKKK